MYNKYLNISFWSEIKQMIELFQHLKLDSFF